MDNNQLNTLSQGATDAATSASNLASDAPTLLNTLKQNLVGIFSNNNPIVGARNNALSDYLSEGANSRAAMLPQNVGDVPGYTGRPLTLSPTEQDAITTSKNAAAYAPLNGYNAILQAMFGQIPDMVKNAGDIYSSTINSANDRAKIAQQQYEDALQQYSAEQKASNSGGILSDPTVQAILAAMMGGSGNNNTTTPTRPSLDSFMKKPTQSQSTKTTPALPGGVYQPNTSGASATLAAPKKKPATASAPAFDPSKMKLGATPSMNIHLGGTYLPFTL